MSLKPQPDSLVPADTQRVAQAVLRDTLFVSYRTLSTNEF